MILLTAMLFALHPMTGKAPGYSDENYSVYQTGLSSIIGSRLLELTEKQYATPEIESYGSGMESSSAHGYGSYSFDACVAWDRPGGHVAAGYLYADNSATEIDVELWGGKAWFTNWVSVTAYQQSSVSLDLSAWHRYSFTWDPNAISYYVDGKLVAVHTAYVPYEPARFYFTMRGTNSDWGGRAEPNTSASFFVRNVRLNS